MSGSVGHIRFTGMASNMDIDKLVSDLMKGERLQLNKLNRNKQSAIWKREAYQSVNSNLLAFRNSVNSLRFEGDFASKKSTSSAPNVADVVSTSGSTTNSTYALNVKTLARSASIIGGQVSTAVDTPVTEGGTITVEGTKGSSQITIQQGTSTIDSIVKNINMESGKTGVAANFDKSSGRIFLSSTDTGLASKVKITDAGDTFKNIFNIPAASTLEAKGANSVYTVNGSEDISSSTNNVDMNGIKINLRSVGTTSIGTITDTNNVMDKIKDFVKKYNELVDTFSTSYKQKRNKEYKPLLDEEKSSMNEKQTEMWEKKAKEGILYNDPILSSTLNSFRNALKLPVNGASDTMNMLSDIGITVESDYKQNGKLKINEKKLQEALDNRPDDVKALFIKTPTTAADIPATPGNVKKRREESGISERLYAELDIQMKRLTRTMGSGTSLEALDDSVIGRELNTIKKAQDKWKVRLQDIEARYYKRFNAMEKAMQKLNSQGSWLNQQLGKM
ncbi:flagellar filament capping protein FliD [Paenibacillus sp. 481]|uniref:flagellar filament capping protein FliD n=1 Tax=Paenibacillus sp. 481 TaxID=2835869 RepID=UPI001E626CD2|nr:flagellar filament capping protein FliD [Paenibacillus sp. 481]UHA75714.1 flagellar filament capping protein FliD [Paenibacillus sp. 481]